MEMVVENIYRYKIPLDIYLFSAIYSWTMCAWPLTFFCFSHRTTFVYTRLSDICGIWSYSIKSRCHFSNEVDRQIGFINYRFVGPHWMQAFFLKVFRNMIKYTKSIKWIFNLIEIFHENDFCWFSFTFTYSHDVKRWNMRVRNISIANYNFIGFKVRFS